jgi:hypothetical protein
MFLLPANVTSQIWTYNPDLDVLLWCPDRKAAKYNSYFRLLVSSLALGASMPRMVPSGQLQAHESVAGELNGRSSLCNIDYSGS